METSLRSFLVSIPIAVILWALMLLAVAAAVILMAEPRASSDAAARSRTTRSRTTRSRTTRSRTTRSRTTRSRAAGLGAAVAGTAVAGTAVARTAVAGTAVAGTVVARTAARRPETARRIGGDSAAGVSTLDGGGAVGEELRFAGEVSIAAERAAATVARCRAEWEVAREELDAAWEAYEQADAAARRTWAATAYPLMSRRRKLGENADRERYLHRAAAEACRRRELSIAQLNEVYAHRSWNPRLHPVVQEALLHNAIRDHRFAAYQAAGHRERAAWQRSEVAAEALRVLRAEAAAAFGRAAVEEPAAGEFWWAEPWTTSELPLAA